VTNPVPGKTVHHHGDGSRHVDDEATEVRDVYVAHLTLTRAGNWGLSSWHRDRTDGAPRRRDLRS
jgi:hypothetical protein